MNATGRLKGLRVTEDGTGIVSHAGVALVRALADNIGLTAGLSKALASDRLLVHDRGRMPTAWRTLGCLHNASRQAMAVCNWLPRPFAASAVNVLGQSGVL